MRRRVLTLELCYFQVAPILKHTAPPAPTVYSPSVLIPPPLPSIATSQTKRGKKQIGSRQVKVPTPRQQLWTGDLTATGTRPTMQRRMVTLRPETKWNQTRRIQLQTSPGSTLSSDDDILQAVEPAFDAVLHLPYSVLFLFFPRAEEEKRACVASKLIFVVLLECIRRVSVRSGCWLCFSVATHVARLSVSMFVDFG